MIKSISLTSGSGQNKYRYSGIADGIQVTVFVLSDAKDGTYEKALLTARENGYEPSFMLGYDQEA
jgi:hypothetical protein